MRADVPGGKPRQAGEQRAGASVRDARREEPAWRGEQALTLADLMRTITLMETVAQVENDLAASLRAMAAGAESTAAARRLKLAEEAVQGAHQAAEHGEHLQREVSRWAEHAGVAALRQALNHAGKVLADLARAENDIANILTTLASRNGSDLAAERRKLAEQASAAAQRANDRAQALRLLGGSSAAKARPEG